MRQPAKQTPGMDVPFPEFIEECFAPPGQNVWALRAALEQHPTWGTMPADGSADHELQRQWEQLRRWELGQWGAVYDGESGAVRCGWYVNEHGRDVVVEYRYPPGRTA